MVVVVEVPITRQSSDDDCRQNCSLFVASELQVQRSLVAILSLVFFCPQKAPVGNGGGGGGGGGGGRVVCVLHIKPFFLPVDTQHGTPSVRADSSILEEEIQVLLLRHYDTHTLSCYAVRRVGNTNAVPLHRIRQAQHTHRQQHPHTKLPDTISIF